jgi:hypothetical protein
VQRGDPLGLARGGAEQPDEDRDAHERVHQRADTVGIAHVGLGARGGDPLGGVRVAGRAAHGVPVERERAGERTTAASASDDQHPRHAADLRVLAWTSS